jgi:AraC-like DNA-binding protein
VRLEELEVEETVVRIVAEVLAGARHASGLAPTAATGDPRPLADRARELILARFAEPLSLTAMATRLAVSPFHLCRQFRRATGTTLHAYRTQVRLRTALERLGDHDVDLTDLALDLGYSSHSHFTTSFRRAFGVPPSAARDRFATRAGRERLLAGARRRPASG